MECWGLEKKQQTIGERMSDTEAGWVEGWMLSGGTDMWPEEFAANASMTALWYRTLQGVAPSEWGKLVGTSLWRSWEHNESIGGSETSQHLDGLAFDGYFPNVASVDVVEEVAKLLRGAEVSFDQLIAYDASAGGHLHIGFGGKGRMEVAKYVNGTYSVVGGAPNGGAGWVGWFLLAALAVGAGLGIEWRDDDGE